MRPQSIIMFERLFLASLAVGAIITAIGYEEIVRVVTSDPGMQRFGLGSGFLIGLIAVSYAIYLLLWYLIAHKAAAAAKWILVVFVALGGVAIPFALSGPLDLTTIVNLAVYALEVAALIYLFRADAKAWFKGEQPADPAAFD
jgi:hypothetical protein